MWQRLKQSVSIVAELLQPHHLLFERAGMNDIKAATSLRKTYGPFPVWSQIQPFHLQVAVVTTNHGIESRLL
jgi:hypothetical protein